MAKLIDAKPFLKKKYANSCVHEFESRRIASYEILLQFFNVANIWGNDLIDKEELVPFFIIMTFAWMVRMNRLIQETVFIDCQCLEELSD